jgi:hypothetical protein
MKKLVLILFATTLVFVGVGQARDQHAADAQIVVRLTEVPRFIEPSERCPGGTLVFPNVASASGEVIGRGRFCILLFNQVADDTVVFAMKFTLRLSEGKISGVLEETEVFSSPSTATSTITGIVTRGTGHFAKFGGVVSGGGSITFDPDGTPDPDITLTIDLASDQVPVKGSDRGSFVVTPTDDPAVVLTQERTEGRATRIGRYTLVAQELINLQTLEVTDGAFTITTAKGDTIEGVYSGQAQMTSPGVITYVAFGPITGGTGRFAGATGNLAFHGVANLATLELSETVTGTISRPHASEDE